MCIRDSFNTIESLLEVKNEVSTLDILKALPSEEISLDIDNLISIISSWKDELAMQQNLILKLNNLYYCFNYTDLFLTRICVIKF